MTERKVMKVIKRNKGGQQREKTEGEKELAAAVQKMKENGTIKSKPQRHLENPNVEAGSEAPTKEAQAGPQAQTKTEPSRTAQAASKKESQVVPFAPALDKKKEKFEDKHNRVTTYISKKNHEKLKWIRKEHGTPVSETINKALEEYFQKYYL